MKKLFIILLAILISTSLLTSCSANGAKVSDLEKQVTELQSQVDQLQSQVTPPSQTFTEEELLDVDLKELAEKIIAECPPPEGVELVWDYKSKDKVFNLDNEEEIVDLSLIEEFLWIYNSDSCLISNNNSTEYIFNTVLVKLSSNVDNNTYERSLRQSIRKLLDGKVKVLNLHLRDNKDNILYNIYLSDLNNDYIDSIEEIESNYSGIHQIVLNSIH